MESIRICPNSSQAPGQSIMKKAIYMIPETPNRVGKHLVQSGMKSVDMVISTEFMTQMTACLSRRWGVPAVILSTTFQVHPHHFPPWPFPVHVTKKRGGRVSTSDNLSFLQRLGFAIIKPLAALSWAYVVTQFQLSYFEFECPVTRSYAELFPGIYAPQIVPTVIGFEYPRTSSPLTHYVGAVVSKNPQNLSAELETWLDSKPERSVVFVSMGSVAQLSAEHGKAIVNAIQVTGHSAIWSLRENNRYILEGLELDKERFSILSWVPQLAALQHKAISLAILQGGMNGVHEAIYFGVPVITVPFVNDQADVSARVDHHEVGIQLLRSQLTTDNLVASINAIEAGTYRNQVSRLGKAFHFAGGVDRAAELVEYYHEVGYDHLVPAYAKYEWSWIQYYNVDVYALMFAVVGLITYISAKLCCCVCRRCKQCILAGRKTKKE